MPAKPISLDDVITEIEHVFADHVQRPPLAHDVSAYNQVHAAFEHLKSRLVALVTGKPAASPAPASDTAEPPAEPPAPESKSKPAA